MFFFKNNFIVYNVYMIEFFKMVNIVFVLFLVSKKKCISYMFSGMRGGFLYVDLVFLKWLI